MVIKRGTNVMTLEYSIGLVIALFLAVYLVVTLIQNGNHHS